MRSSEMGAAPACCFLPAEMGAAPACCFLPGCCPRGTLELQLSNCWCSVVQAFLLPLHPVTRKIRGEREGEQEVYRGEG